MRKVWILYLLFVLSSIQVVADNYLDSLYKEYHQAKSDSARYDVLYNIVVEYTEKGSSNYNPDAIKVLLEKTIRELRRQKLIAYTTGVILVFTGIIAFLMFRNFHNQKKANYIISSEKKRSDELLHNILPAEVAQELKTNGSSEAKIFHDVTVMFTDFKDFTLLSKRRPIQEIVDTINFYYSAFDEIIARHGIEKIKTITGLENRELYPKVLLH